MNKAKEIFSVIAIILAVSAVLSGLWMLAASIGHAWLWMAYGAVVASLAYGVVKLIEEARNK